MTESIVSKAFYLWLTGRRKWNPAEYSDLQSFLKGIVDSLLSHAANSHDNRLIESVDIPLHVSQGNPESELLEKERSAESEYAVREIVHQAQHDAVALVVINAIRAGAVTRREIVEATGRPVPDIDNALKRLRRIGAQIVRSRKDENAKVRC